MQFTVPRFIYLGAGSISSVTEIPSKKAVIFADQTMVKFGWCDRIKKLLEDNDTQVLVYSDIPADPNRTIVSSGLKMVNEFKPDLFIGIGGGSAIDVGKAVWVFYELPNLTWDEAIIPFTLPKIRNKARYIAIPSTSGTGTEVGTGAVIVNNEVDPPVKQWIDSYETVPDIAILDPEICLSLPLQPTANTGLDVLAHAFEAITVPGANEFIDAVAIKAIQMTFQWLPRAYENGQDLEAREKMQMASTLAGMAFNNAGLGIMHSLAHQLGSVFGVPHGKANALVMPYVIAYNCRAAQKRYADIALAIGITGTSIDQLVIGLLNKIQSLKQRVGIPLSIKECGIDVNKFNSLLDVISKNALNDGCVPGNPVQPDVNDLKMLYQLAWEGKSPELCLP